jgi:transposase
MTDNDLYQQILGLSSPWRVTRVELLLDANEVLVHVVHDASLGPAQCPICHSGCPGYDTADKRRWRHLDTCQLKTFLVCRVPRIQCPEHGVHVAFIPWSVPNSRFTIAFEALALTILRATTVQGKAAQLLRLTATQMHDLMHRAVARGLARRAADTVMHHLGLDEKSIHRGHSYITVLTDISNRRVVEVAEERTLAATKDLLKAGVSEKQRPFVRSVAMDMWQAFQTARESELPDADHVHDRFHVAKYLADAVDKTRRSEHKRLSRDGDKSLSGSKYIWLRNPENLNAKQQALFKTLMSAELTTAKVWAFKEAFKGFFAREGVEEGRAFFDNWFHEAVALGNTHLTKVAEMLKNHLQGLLNYLKHRTTNAVAEGLNSQIQYIKASARGYRRFESFRVAILFFLGKLDMNPLTSP